MCRLRFHALSLALFVAIAFVQGDLTTPKPEIIDVSPPSTASEPLVNSITSSTTPATNTTSTTAPGPTTTTSTTTTTEPTTTTSTTTTTQAPPPPTPAPTPAPPRPLPPPEQGTWNVTENNVTCILVQFAAQLNVTYTKNVNNSTILDHVVLNVPANASVVDGSCDGTRQWLKLGWPSGLADNNLTLVFQRNDSTKQYALASLNVSLTPDIFPNSSSADSIELYHGAEWATPLATSYRCIAPAQLNMTAETASVVATLTLAKLQEEAFRTNREKGFSAARDCGSADLPDAVPIAVGVALGALVLVVLAAYLIGRRRSAARGYLSM